MIDKYVLATNDDGDLAIRTVSATESSSVTDTTSVITATDDGKLAVRVVGAGGGSDPHNLGYYADLTALQTAHPTGTDGDFAILGSTDTIWVWDSDTSAWKDTDTKGQVTSVNGQTGAVTLTIPAAQVNSDWNASSGVAKILNKPTIPAAIQVSTMPTAAVGELDKIYQFIGTTDANYTNGYFYKCVSDGQNPATYSWTQTDVQPQAGGLPSQTGQSGKFLTTDGTDASWSDKPLVNTATGTDSLTIAGPANVYAYSINIGKGTNVASNSTESILIGVSSYNPGQQNVVIGRYAGTGAGASRPNSQCVLIGYYAGIEGPSGAGGGHKIAIGYEAKVVGNINYAIQLGGGTNSETGTFCVGSYYNNASVNYKLMDADGTIPTDRYTTTPSADGTYVPTLTISSGVATRSWAAPSGGGSTALSLTLAAANWSNNSITVTATGVTASNNVIVSPAPASQSAYTTAGVMCTGQSTNSLTFTATTTPSSDIVVTVLIV